MDNKQKMMFILRFFENNTLKCKKYTYSYLYALMQKSEFGPIIARVKPRRGMLVYIWDISFCIKNPLKYALDRDWEHLLKRVINFLNINKYK